MLSPYFATSTVQVKVGVLHPVQFIYLGFYIAFNTIQVISRRVVGRAEETSTYSSLGLCTVNCRPTASNYQLSHLRPSWGSNPGLRGGRPECYHSATVAPTPCSTARVIFRQVLNSATCGSQTLVQIMLLYFVEAHTFGNLSGVT